MSVRRSPGLQDWLIHKANTTTTQNENADIRSNSSCNIYIECGRDELYRTERSKIYILAEITPTDKICLSKILNPPSLATELLRILLILK